MNKTIFAFLFVFSVIAGLSVNSAYAVGEESYNKGLEIFNKVNITDEEYKKAFSYFVQAAKEGNADAFFMLGLYPDLGLATRKKPEVAFMRYKRSADLGNAEAMFSVADMYMNGEGVDHDVDEAVSWFEKAALKGNAEAAYNLGAMYRMGIGVKHDAKKSRYWFDESYRLGNPTALFVAERYAPVTLYRRIDRSLKK